MLFHHTVVIMLIYVHVTNQFSFAIVLKVLQSNQNKIKECNHTMKVRLQIFSLQRKVMNKTIFCL